MKQVDNKIVSRFYVIYGNNAPIYVGYTNRTVKQRFNEHQKYKDFSSYSKVEVKEVDRLEFDFTWDMIQVNDNARKVSDRESELINQYGTTNSIYQRGLGSIQGGQTWASVKGFVHSNKDNPKYIGMSDNEVAKYFIEYHNNRYKIKAFVGSFKNPQSVKLSGFVKNYKDDRISKLSHFVSNYKNPQSAKLSGFVKNYKDDRISKLSHFVSHYKNPEVIKLANFVTHYRSVEYSKLANFIGNYK